MKYEYGDMVIVDCQNGHNVGFIDHEVLLSDYYKIHHESNKIPKKILSFNLDDDQIIRNMLQMKITAENYALHQCQTHIKGSKLSLFSDIISTEFQFDRKKLTIYIKKFENVSVCRLARKIRESFKMHIKVFEIQRIQTLHDFAWKYFEISKLNVPFNEIFTFNMNSRSITPFLNVQSHHLEEDNFPQTTNIHIDSELFKNSIQPQQVSPSSPSSPTFISDNINSASVAWEQYHSSYHSQYLEEMRDHSPQIISNIHNNTSATPRSLYPKSYSPQQQHNYQSQLPRNTTQRQNGISLNKVKQLPSECFESYANQKPIVWSSLSAANYDHSNINTTMINSNNNIRLENNSKSPYNASTKLFYSHHDSRDKSKYYFPYNNHNQKYQQYYPYKQQPESESQFYENYDQSFSGDINYNNTISHPNQLRDSNLNELQYSSQIRDGVNELNSQFVGKINQRASNSTNYRYVFESSLK